MADANLHQVSANHEFAREALACGQQLFSRGISGHNVAEDKFLHACRFRYCSDLFDRRMGGKQMFNQAFVGGRTRRRETTLDNIRHNDLVNENVCAFCELDQILTPRRISGEYD